jgi:exonuclease III
MVDFLRIHDIDIALLQEVTSPQIVTIRRYTKHINIGTKRRGTAILAKEDLSHTNLKILPPGRVIAATFNGTCLVNIYASQGKETGR